MSGFLKYKWIFIISVLWLLIDLSCILNKQQDFPKTTVDFRLKDTVIMDKPAYMLFITLNSDSAFYINQIYVGKFDKVNNKMIGKYDSILVINNIGQVGLTRNYSKKIRGVISAKINKNNILIPFEYKIKK